MGEANRGGRSRQGLNRGGGRDRADRSPKPGPIGLTRVGGDDFELVHPRGVKEMELDYEEGIEIWKAGDPESARDALRYALSACHENIWAHVALGRIALVEFRDPALARGHFGYAFELGQRALPRDFTGRLPRDRPEQSAVLRGPRRPGSVPGGAGPARRLQAASQRSRDRLSGGPA